MLLGYCKVEEDKKRTFMVDNVWGNQVGTSGELCFVVTVVCMKGGAGKIQGVLDFRGPQNDGK